MQPVVQRLRRLAYLWDSVIGIPGTRIRLGLDPLIGLVPGLGDAAGALVASYVVLEAARLDVPPATLLRMVANVAIDAVLGTVPVLGDLFDVAWKANLKNVALIEQHLADPHGARAANRLWLMLVFLVLALLAALGIGAGWLVTRALIRLL